MKTHLRKRHRKTRSYKRIYILVTALALLVTGSLAYMLLNNKGEIHTINVKVGSTIYTFNIGYNTKLTYSWEQWLVYPNGTRIPFGKPSSGAYTYVIVNVSTQQIFGIKEIPIWFVVRIVKNGVELKGTSKVYFTSIALPMQLLGKPFLNLTPIKTTINIRGKSFSVWEYQGKIKPRSPECYILEDKYYYLESNGLLVKEEVRCYIPHYSSYPNGTYILYYKELLEANN